MGIFGPPKVQRMRVRRDVKGLVKALTYPNAGVRADAARALGELGDRSATASLSAALADAERRVGAAAAWALGQIGEPQAAEPLLAALAVRSAPSPFPHERSLRLQGELELHAAAANALVRIGSAALEALCRALQDGKGNAVEVALVLSRIGDPRAVPGLCAALQDPRPTLRRVAAEALARLKEPGAVEPLGAALGDADWWVRANVAKALGAIGGAGAVAPLCTALSDREESVRVVAARALVGLTDARARELIARAGAIAPLCRMLEMDSAEGRMAAAVALGWLGATEALAPLGAALTAPGASLRAAAARALGQIGDPRAVDALCTAVQDKEWSGVRRAAAEALLAIYRSGRLDEEASRRILALRDAMAAPHTDVSGECGHTDQGTGVSF